MYFVFVHVEEVRRQNREVSQFSDFERTDLLFEPQLVGTIDRVAPQGIVKADPLTPHEWSIVGETRTLPSDSRLNLHQRGDFVNL